VAEEEDLWRIQFQVFDREIVAVELLLERFGIDAVEVQDGDTLIPGDVRPQTAYSSVIAYGSKRDLSHLQGAFRAEFPDRKCALARFEDRDWLEIWKEFIPVTVIADRIVVRPPFRESPDQDLPEVVIDPGMAFGTGGHETTRIVLELAIRHLERGQGSAPCLPIADVGCGSGVIGACLVRLGWGPVFGCDTDATSIEVAREVLQENGVHDQVHVVHGSANALEGTFPLLIANILAKHLLTIAASIRARTEPGATVILSGILTERLDDFLSDFNQDCPVIVREQLVMNEWVGVRLERL